MLTAKIANDTILSRFYTWIFQASKDNLSSDDCSVLWVYCQICRSREFSKNNGVCYVFPVDNFYTSTKIGEQDILNTILRYSQQSMYLLNIFIGKFTRLILLWDQYSKALKIIEKILITNLTILPQEY